jgi:hypothetical protein
MKQKRYIHRPVGDLELRSLVELAKEEEQAFFQRNPHLIRTYRNRLLAVALCQGSALQYVGKGYGVNDFDIHFFYEQNPAKPRLSRAVKRIFADVGSFAAAPVDFIRTVMPSRPADKRKSTTQRIRQFLEEQPTANATHLAKKAVVAISPKSLFAKVWQPRLNREG